MASATPPQLMNIEEETYNSVGSMPSSYCTGRESCLNETVACASIFPKRMAFSMSTNSAYLFRCGVEGQKCMHVRTLIFLPEDLLEDNRVTHASRPGFRVKREAGRDLCPSC